MKYISLLILVTATILFSAAQAQVAPGSTWENQRGSVLTINTINADGSFEGTYVNNAPGFSCQGTPYQVTGWRNNNAIGWMVNWKNASADCASVTSWAGVILSPTLIESSWILGYTSPAFGPRIMTGSDFFSKK